MANVSFELSENGLDVLSPKEILHMGPDGTTLNLYNLTEEERELIERYRYDIENIMGIKINIEEVAIDG